MKKLKIIILLSYVVVLYTLAAPLLAEPYTITETQLQKLTILCNQYKTERAEALKKLENCENELTEAQTSTENLNELLKKSAEERQQIIKQIEKQKQRANAWKSAALVSIIIIAIFIIVMAILIKL